MWWVLRLFHLVKIHLSADQPPPFVMNYRGFLGSSLAGQLAFFVNVADVQTDGVRLLVKQFGSSFKKLPLGHFSFCRKISNLLGDKKIWTLSWWKPIRPGFIKILHR